MRILLTKTLAITICAFACHTNAKDKEGTTWPTVNLQLSVDRGVPTQSALIWDSQEMASIIYSRIHIRLNWRNRRTKKDAQNQEICAATPIVIIQVALHAPPNVSNSALAMAAPYARSGVRIVVFYDRVSPLLRGHSAPEATVFGYVLAHEIGHVLQGTARHSDVGVMRARWASSDFVEMGKVLLTFTKEDEEQIRVRLSANACGSGPSKSDRRVDRASLPLAPSAIK